MARYLIHYLIALFSIMVVSKILREIMFSHEHFIFLLVAALILLVFIALGLNSHYVLKHTNWDNSKNNTLEKFYLLSGFNYSVLLSFAVISMLTPHVGSNDEFSIKILATILICYLAFSMIVSWAVLQLQPDDSKENISTNQT